MNNELYHYGIKGQKWGVRRYQNKDGTLTPAGKKKYSNMSDDKLQKTLYKQVKQKRAEQSGQSNKWMVSNTIGQNSEKAWKKYIKDRDAYENSDVIKQANKKRRDLDRRLEKGQMDLDQYDKAYEEIRKSVYKADLDSSVRYGSKGRQYSQEYLNKYGNDINIGYLKDLGYDDATAKEFASRVLKSNRKTLYGM